MPLDRLYLHEHSSAGKHEVTRVGFGPNEIVRLDRRDLSQRVPVEALARFGSRYQFPVAELDGFCWMVTSRIEPAGPLERRTWLNILNESMDDLDGVRLFRSSYPMPVENALFVLLLILLKDPGETPWQAFRVPWIFSVTDDLFSDPAQPPDPSALSRDIVGDEHDHSEVPAESEIFEFGARQRDALHARWNDLETVLVRADRENANFHPLTRHFFVKALSEHGVDEIISNLSCLEATLQLKRDRNRDALKRRYTRLVADDDGLLWLNTAYRLRDEYLHSLADPERELTWTDLARTRWAVATAVGRYLDFAIKRPDLNRRQILKQLDPQRDLP